MGKLMERRTTTDAFELLYDRFVRGDPEAERMFEEESINAEIAQQIYDLRTKAGLSQKALAKLIGTQASVICRLEDSDYEGHSLAMLKRIAAALGYRVEVRLVSEGNVGKRRVQKAPGMSRGYIPPANEMERGSIASENEAEYAVYPGQPKTASLKKGGATKGVSRPRARKMRSSTD